MAMSKSPAEAKAEKEQKKLTKQQTEQALGITLQGESNISSITIHNEDGTDTEIKITAPEPEFKIEKKVIKSKRKNLILYAHVNDGIEQLAKKMDTSFNNLVNLILEDYIKQHSK